jgi:hypothetical protein
MVRAAVSNLRRRILIGGAIGFGFALSAALAIKIVVFDPNWRFTPACIHRSGAVFFLQGFQTELFRDAVASGSLNHMMEHGYRVDRQGVYISVLDGEFDYFLNHTTKVIQYLEQVKMNALVKNPHYIALKKLRGQFPPRPSDHGDINCDLVAAVAIVGEPELAIDPW